MKVKQTQQGIPSAFCDDSSQETVAKDQDSVRCLPFRDQKEMVNLTKTNLSTNSTHAFCWDNQIFTRISDDVFLGDPNFLLS